MKKAVLFRCPQCIAEFEAEKGNKESIEITLETGEIFSSDEVYFIPVKDNIRCAKCGDVVSDIVLDTNIYGENPWILYAQEGETETSDTGFKRRHMKVAGRFDTLSKAMAEYNQNYKPNDKVGRITLRNETQMIVVVELEPGKEVTYPATILKFRENQ